MARPEELTPLYTPSEVVEGLYYGVLRREPDSAGLSKHTKDLSSQPKSAENLTVVIRAFLQSEEYHRLMRLEYERRAKAAIPKDRVAHEDFRIPSDLSVSPVDLRRVLIVGSCFAERWGARLKTLLPNCGSDIYQIGALPEQPVRPIQEYGFQVVQLPLRAMIPDTAFARLKQDDVAGHERLFDHAAAAMRQYVHDATRWNRTHGILTFVTSFVVPQQNFVGRLLPRYDIRNPVYFVEKLNQELASEVQHLTNAYFFDINEVISSYGRMFVNEDVHAQFNHGGLLNDFDFEHDDDRLETAGKASAAFESKVEEVLVGSWRELVSLYRTVRQVDAVKLVVIDLDDTLWRGLVGEAEAGEMKTAEGWPLAFREALNILKRRGILLGIISKNSEEFVVKRWNEIVGRHLTLDDFAVRRINWRSKAENMAELLADVNLLPGSVVYIDDNPVERTAINAAFPDIRVLGGSPLTWRRILLWSTETQPISVTAESAVRTEMVRAQVTREKQRAALSREDYLASLNARINFFQIHSTSDQRFQRTLELINKTNQFNTTGKRWTLEDCQQAFATGAEFYAFEVEDTFTSYGLVGVLILDGGRVRQFVMSCRVLGIDVELAAVAVTASIVLRRGKAMITADLVDTGRNLPCQDVYARCGFTNQDGVWERDIESFAPPTHIEISIES